jgi:hypothetical protein
MKIKCEFCEREFSSKGIGTHIWRTHKGNTTLGFKGKTFSDETKKLLSDKTKISWSKGIFDNIDYGSSFRGKLHSESSKLSIAISMKGNRNGKHRGKTIIDGNHKFKSTWEHKTSLYLSLNNIGWSYEEVVFSLSNRSSYMPDFYIKSLDKYIEVKGYWRKENLEKFNKFLLLYPDINIEVWDKNVLKELKII